MLTKTRTDTKNRLVAAALEYAEKRWPIFPLTPGTKRPATPNHSAHECDQTDHRCWPTHTGWEQRATTDRTRITRAWSKRPYGIAIACGPANLLVIDLDTGKDGQPSGAETLCRLEAELGEKLPDTYTVATPSGGYHYYYTQPAGIRLGNTAGKLGPGIDTRGHGGYVAAPPTKLTNSKTGRPYETIRGRHQPPAELPPCFSELLTTQAARSAETCGQSAATVPSEPLSSSARLDRYVNAAIRNQIGYLTAAPKHSRNQALFTAASTLGQLIGAGAADHNDVAQQLLNATTRHIQNGAFTWKEAERTIASGIHRGQQKPRQLPAHLTNN